MRIKNLGIESINIVVLYINYKNTKRAHERERLFKVAHVFKASRAV